MSRRATPAIATGIAMTLRSLAGPTLALILLSACAPSDPVDGESCSASDDAVCEGAEGAGARSWALFECVGGKWKRIPCRSGGLGNEWGCITTELDIECKFNQVRAGDACWSRYEGLEHCAYGVADSKLTCRGGEWVAETCVNCRRESGQPLTCD